MINEKGFYIPDKCVDRCSQIIDKPKVKIVFVDGKPGSGKTGVALSLLSQYIEKKKKVKYATGNGNLYKIIAQTLKNEDEKTNGINTEIIQRFNELYKEENIIKKDIIKLYEDKQEDEILKEILFKYQCKNKANIILIDEAQRMWSSEKIAFGEVKNQNKDKYEDKYEDDIKKFIIKNCLSQSLMLFIDLYKSAIESKEDKTIVFFCGNGQEIYKGEEEGKDGIIKSVKKVAEIFKVKVDTEVYSANTEDNNSSLNEILDKSQENQKLRLDSERRNKFEGVDAGLIVDNLFENKSNVYEKITPFTIVSSKEELVKEYRERKKLYPGKSHRFFMTQYEKWNEEDVKLSAVDKDGQSLLDFFEGKSNPDKDEKYYATEFEAQGLEVDYAYFVWGDTVKFENGKLKVKEINDNLKKLNDYFNKINEFYKNNSDLKQDKYSKKWQQGKLDHIGTWHQCG
jgi:hypothetical protein